ncbi:MAG: sigma-70 family RNA polymerase sigma factor [Chloroflexi bacterium]|nr:sigma-70 family RNA polymerase sigma factor [Chloroflexota bacterium]
MASGPESGPEDRPRADALHDDPATVAQAVAGDQQAFARLQAACEHVVRCTIRLQVGRRTEDGRTFVDRALVDDLVQVTWVQVWQKLPTYKPELASFATFARYWARIMVRRYRDTPVGKGIETPIGSLLDRDDADDGPNDAFDRFGASSASQAPDDAIAAEVYDELLLVTFQTASPPHQLIVFGLTKATDLKPRQIAAEFSHEPLTALADRLERAYLDRSDLPASRIRPAFEPLRDRLTRRFDEVVRDPTTLATYPHVHSRIVGETTLAEYYTAEPTANLTQWWHAVKRRVIADLQRRADGPLAELLRQSQRMNARRGVGERPSR